MNTKISVSYNISRPSNDTRAYTISMQDTDRSEAELQSVGPTLNDIARHVGVYVSRQAAIQALLNYIGANNLVVMQSDDGRLAAVFPNSKHLYAGWRILASRSNTGTWISSTL